MTMRILQLAVVAVMLVGAAMLVNAAASRRTAKAPLADPAREAARPSAAPARIADRDPAVDRSGPAAVRPAGTVASKEEERPAWSREKLLKKLRTGTAEERRDARKILAETTDASLVREAVAVLFDTRGAANQLLAVELIREHGLREECPRLVTLMSMRATGPNLREQAALAVSELGDASLTPDLRRVYTEGDVPSRRVAAQVLDNLGDRGYVTDFLRQAAEALQDRRPERMGNRLILVAETGMMEGDTARPVMLGALSDPAAAVRYHGVFWLGEHGGAGDVQYLELLKSDADENIRAAVDDALAKIKGRTNG